MGQSVTDAVVWTHLAHIIDTPSQLPLLHGLPGTASPVREARPTWRRDAAAQRREQRTQQQRLSKAGLSLCHQVYSADGHGVILRSRQLISDVQEVEDLPWEGHKLKGKVEDRQTGSSHTCGQTVL